MNSPQFNPHPSPTRFSSPSKRKRSRSPPNRRITPRPTTSLPTAYIDLLNLTTLEARQRRILSSPSAPRPIDLPASRLGATDWAHHEKHALFDALERTSKTELAALAVAVKTKSEVEVAQYLAVVEEAMRRRRRRGRKGRVEMGEMKGAAEISQGCILACERVADVVARRQEGHEEGIERGKWGEVWRVDAVVAGELDREVEMREEARRGDPEVKLAEMEVPFAELFRCGVFVGLARRVFMNAVLPEYNWEFLGDGQEPAVRATALEDFRGVIVSLLKRMVYATVMVAEGRIRTKGTGKRIVHRRDVEAAVANMGLGDRGGEFWARAPRRLRLRVVDDGREVEEGVGEQGGDQEDEEVHSSEVDTDQDTDGQHSDFKDPFPQMTYEEVEAQLLTSALETDGPIFFASDDEVYSSDDPASRPLSPLFPVSSPPGPTGQETTEDLQELFEYTAVDFGDTGAVEAALRTRLRREKVEEEEAERVDEGRSRREEARLWEVIGERVPEGLVGKEEEVEVRGKGRGTREVEDVLGEGFGGDWREGIEYVAEWERSG